MSRQFRILKTVTIVDRNPARSLKISRGYLSNDTPWPFQALMVGHPMLPQIYGLALASKSGPIVRAVIVVSLLSPLSFLLLVY